MVLVEGLAVVVSHEQRAVQDLQNRLVVDVGIGVVDEHAGLGVTGRVDVEVVATAGDAAAHELAIVLEVHGIERDIARRRAQIADTVDHVLALFRGGHQLRGGLVAHGHIVEVEAEVCPLLAQKPHERIVGNSVDVLAGVADGGTEEDAVLFEQIHGVHHSGIVAFAAAGVVGLRGALDGQHKGDIAQTLYFFTEWLVNEGRVGIDGKLHIVMLFGQLKHVLLAHQRLAAGQHIQIHAQLLALRNDLIHVLKAEVVLVAVLACPAAHAVHIAGRGGVEQNQPRDVALILDAVLTDHLSAAEEGFVAQIQCGGTRNMGVGLVQHAVDELRPLAVGVGQHLFGVLVGLVAEAAAVELLCSIYQLAHCFFTVLLDARKRHVHYFTKRSTLHLVSQVIKRCIHSFFLPK